MKSFDIYLQRAQVPEWNIYYIDYSNLKEQLRLFGKRRRKLQCGDLDWSTVLLLSPSSSSEGVSGGVSSSEQQNQMKQHQDQHQQQHQDQDQHQDDFGYSTLQDEHGGGCDNIGCDIGGGGCGIDFPTFGTESKEERLSKMEHDEFKLLLQKELKKACIWFQARWLSDLQQQQDQDDQDQKVESLLTGGEQEQSGEGEGQDQDDTDEEGHNQTTEKKEETIILDLYGFLVVNICVLRQLLLRYNAHVRMYDDAGSIFLSEWELFEEASGSGSGGSGTGTGGTDGSSVSVGISISSMITVDVNDSSSTTAKKHMNMNVPSLMDFLEPLQDRMMTMSSYWTTSTMETSLTKDNNNNNNIVNNTVNVDDFRKRADVLEGILDKTSFKQQTKFLTKMHPSNYSKRDRFIQTLRYCYTMGSNQMGISMEPKFLTNVHSGFKKEMKLLALWQEEEQQNNNNNNNGDPSSSKSSTTSKPVTAVGEMDPANVWPLILNLLSCYLFMMNTYIIEPSSAYYANALGSSDAMSGIMMGMAPWFALLSAVGYSVWTNASYKQPILFAGTLMVIGNTLYGVAYSYESMQMCLIGRAISGFGAPRIINRRYVADATPFKLRTMSSAAFALTTALGAASGPGIAILLDMIPEFQFSIPFVSDREQTFNGMTGPGFLMALLWFIYSILIAITFREPNRSGLDELKQREQREAAAMKAKSKKEEDIGPSLEALRPTDTMDSFADEDNDDDTSVGSFNTVEGSSSSPSKNSPLYCIKHMTRATALCMVLIFMKRIALESIVGSTSVITKNRYAWSIRNVGVLHLVNGLIVIPVSIFAGWLSQFREDRYLAMWFMGITSAGMLLMVDFTDLVDIDSSDTYNEDLVWSVGPYQYIAGSLIAFSGVEACESFVASLMSKCVPSALAVGTFNSGLLATLVGTGGRAVGDLFITAMGLISIRNLLNELIIPGLVLMLLGMFLLWRNYKIVAV